MGIEQKMKLNLKTCMWQLLFLLYDILGIWKILSISGACVLPQLKAKGSRAFYSLLTCIKTIKGDSAVGKNSLKATITEKLCLPLALISFFTTPNIINNKTHIQREIRTAVQMTSTCRHTITHTREISCVNQICIIWIHQICNSKTRDSNK